MISAAIRQQLHQYIDIADDTKLEAMYNLVEKDMGNEKYTPAELAEFYSRLEKYNNGEMPGFSVEDAHQYVRINGVGK